MSTGEQAERILSSCVPTNHFQVADALLIDYMHSVYHCLIEEDIQQSVSCLRFWFLLCGLYGKRAGIARDAQYPSGDLVVKSLPISHASYCSLLFGVVHEDPIRACSRRLVQTIDTLTELYGSREVSYDEADRLWATSMTKHVVST